MEIISPKNPSAPSEEMEAPLLASQVEAIPAPPPPMFEVIAPATLQEGYSFEAEVGGSVFNVTVVR